MANLKGTCPTCDAAINFDVTVEVSEISNCPDCQTRVVVDAVESDKVNLKEAPEVEEDWGE